jgi:hypothetical protein
MKEKDHLENLGVDGGIIQKWTLRKLTGRTSVNFYWLGTGTSGGGL